MRIFLLTLLMLIAPQVYAHKPSDSYLQLTPTDRGFTGEWRIALRDLEPAIGLDRDGDRNITWGEVRTRHAEIANYALARLAITANGSPCEVRAGTQLVDDLSDGAYTVLPLAASCERNVAPWTLDYSLLFDVDPTHRGLITLHGSDAPQTFALSPQNSRAVLSASATYPGRQFIEMAREGVWHIWIGFDHILFLLALLLPVGLRRANARGENGNWAPMLKDVLVLVTAFTVAHSVTLSLAALSIVSLPPRLIETAIALSVVVAGLLLRIPAPAPFGRPAQQLLLRIPAPGHSSASMRAWHSGSVPSAPFGHLMGRSPNAAKRRDARELPAQQLLLRIPAPAPFGRPAQQLLLRYAISRPAVWIAFGFGLIHGFGFANVLADMQLPTGSLALSLFAFNIGVELGQCAIVLLALPLIRYAQRHVFYERTFIPVAALLIAAVGIAWSIERGAGISLGL
jgi:hypothetical protein